MSYFSEQGVSFAVGVLGLLLSLVQFHLQLLVHLTGFLLEKDQKQRLSPDAACKHNTTCMHTYIHTENHIEKY